MDAPCPTSVVVYMLLSAARCQPSCGGAQCPALSTACARSSNTGNCGPTPLHAMAKGQRPALSTYVVVLRSRVGMNTGSPTPLAANAVVPAQPSSCGTEHDRGRLRCRKAYCTTCRDGFVCPSHLSLIDGPRRVALIQRLAQILRLG